jgi:fluoride ion exporter CrcB/FEX
MLLITVGGALGCCLRFLISKWIGGQLWGQSFPYGTLVVNVSGGNNVLNASRASNTASMLP